MQQSDRHCVDIQQHHLHTAERATCRGGSQIHIPGVSKDITYALQEGRIQQSDPHSVDITRDYVLPAGMGRTQQSGRHSSSAAIKRDHIHPAGGGEPSSQIDFLEVSKEIPYVLHEGGERSS